MNYTTLWWYGVAVQIKAMSRFSRDRFSSGRLLKMGNKYPILRFIVKDGQKIHSGADWHATSF
jgi:hypothetical protein